MKKNDYIQGWVAHKEEKRRPETYTNIIYKYYCLENNIINDSTKKERSLITVA